MKKVLAFLAVFFVVKEIYGVDYVPPVIVDESVFTLSFLGSDNPRGIRNNNAGNIKITNSAWQGKIPVSQNTDGTFEQFESYAYGVRAMIKILIKYIQNGTNNIDLIINRYAPSSDNNNVQAYIDAVVNDSNLSQFQTLTASKSVLKKLVIPMAFHENGIAAIDDEIFEAAYSLV